MTRADELLHDACEDRAGFAGSIQDVLSGLSIMSFLIGGGMYFFGVFG